MRLLVPALSLLVVALMQAKASATTITNVTTGTTLFSDDYEGVSASTVPAPDTSGSFYPTASVGSWEAGGSDLACVQVTSSTTSPDPGAAEGSNYLRLYRDGSAHNSLVARPTLSAIQSISDQVIRFSTMVYIPGDSAVDYRGVFRMYGGDGSNDYRRVVLDTMSGGKLDYTTSDGVAHEMSGISYTTDVWQRWDLEYAVGTLAFTLAIDGGSPVSGTAFSAGDVYQCKFENGTGTPGAIYLDAVPEPGTLWLMTIGLVGLLAYAWRKQR